jgi:glycosyltransferase involved in cell wall biosynthesis
MKDGLVMVCDVDLEVADATRTHTLEVARLFAAAGLDVELVTRGSDPEVAGVRHHAATGSTTLQRLRSVNGVALRLLWRRRATARRCYVRHEWAQVPVVVAARLLGYVVVTQVDDVQYGAGYEGRITPLADAARRAATFVMGRCANKIVAVTPGIETLLARDYGVDRRKIEVLPNGVDLRLFRPLDRQEAVLRAGLEPRLDYVVFTGLFASWVEFETILRAFALVACERPNARLVLVGDGPRRGEVERLVEENGLRDRVILTGFIADRDRVRDLVLAATVCLVAHWAPRLQRIGASPTKLAEYFAAGRAVVALELPGVKEMVEESGGGIAVPNDAAAMAAAIAALLDDPARADELGAAGRRAAEERYSWESVVNRTVALFGLETPRPRA